MVKTSPLYEALVAYKKKSGLSLAKIGAMGGVSAQAAMKWFRGGDIEAGVLRKLSAASGVDFYGIKYRAMLSPTTAREETSAYGLDPDVEVDRTMVGQIFDQLPEAQREEWLAMGAWLVERYSPRGPGNPLKDARRLPTTKRVKVKK